MIFRPSEAGLYHYAVNNYDFLMLQTVDENRQGYSQRQYEKAKLAREIYHAIGNPLVEDFKKIIRTNGIKNCPVTIEDINAAVKIFGPSISTLKGKSTRRTPAPVINDYIEIPKEIMKTHKDIHLCADIMYVQEVMFLVTISKNIKFMMAEPIEKRSKMLLYEAMDRVFRVYNKAGFNIKYLHVDPEFKFMTETMKELDVTVNLTAAQEHQPEVERGVPLFFF